jgi:SAM-dependent methyltransferase
MIRGICQDMEDGGLHITHDRGYSFCNCWNIFYTDWSNINQSVYDDMYYLKYQCKDTETLAHQDTTFMFKAFKNLRPDAKTFFEIGAVHDYILDDAKEAGYEPEGLDIIEHPSKHPLTISNFEDFVPTKKYDIVWASHVFEHFKNPEAQLLKMKSMLNENGILFIGMPDTFFIDFDNKNPYAWDWVVTEHHVLWGMDSFIEFAESHGLINIFSDRNTLINKKENGEWFWKKEFKAVFENA